jgi:hypothetical protein
VTPARLGVHDDALIGVQVRAGDVVGSFDGTASYVGAPSGSTELDFEQDVFAAARVLPRAQVSMLVPLVETYRRVPTTSELSPGFGDLNVGARYDIYLAGQSRYLPGIAALGGLTIPSGTPPELASKPLATDATGSGFVQVTAGLALEQVYGPWLFNVTGLVAGRPPRSARGVEEALGPQLTVLGAAAYTFDNEAALAFIASYTLEGDATVDGKTADGTARRVLQLSLGGLWPIDDRWHLQGSLFANPPFDGLGRNAPVSWGLALGLIRLWS